MIVISIGDIIAWVLGGIGLVVVLALLLIDLIGRRREKRLMDKWRGEE